MKLVAANKIKTYVKETYGSMDLELSEVAYNFKIGGYYAIASSKTSEDTHFEVTYVKGNVSDYYKYDVPTMWNTFQRLDEEYRNKVEPIIADNMPYQFDMIIGGLDKEGSYGDGKLSLDIAFDLGNMPLSQYVTVYVYAENLSWDNVAKMALELDALLMANGFTIDQYDVILEKPAGEEDKPKESLGVYEFPRKLLSSDNLPKVMEEHQRKWELEGEKIKNEEKNS